MRSVVRRPHIATKKNHKIFSASRKAVEPTGGKKHLDHADKFKPPQPQNRISLSPSKFPERGKIEYED